MSETIITVTLKRERETKGTWFYVEDTDRPCIRNIYLSKRVIADVFNGDPPELLRVVISHQTKGVDT